MDVTINYTPHENQLEIHQSPARFKVAVCGRRFGKTTFALNELILNAISNYGSVNWYVAPTYRNAKEAAWDMLFDYLPESLIEKKNETELKVKLVKPIGSEIALKGADNRDSLRGKGVGMVVLDEFAFMDPKVWPAIIRPMLVDSAGKAIFIGTPSGYNHFYELYMKGVKEEDGFKSFHFTSYDNPKLPEGEIDLAKKDTPDEDYFAQEFLADFRRHVGLVYREFDRKVHIVKDIDFDKNWAMYRAIDFGYSNPSCVLWIGVDYDDNWYIWDEFYDTGVTSETLASAIRNKSVGMAITNTWADSAQMKDIEELKKLGFYVTPVIKSSGTRFEDYVRFGIQKVKDHLAIQGNGKPKLFVHAACGNTIKEFESYSWQMPKEGKNLQEKPRQKDDHAMDCIRYFATMYQRRDKMEVKSQWKDKDWKIGM